MVDGITYVTRDEVSKKPIFVRKPYDKPPINPLKCLLDRLPRSLPESAPEVVASGETRRPTLLQTCQHLRRDWRASRSLAYDPKEWIPSSKSPTPGRATQTSRRGSSSTASTLIGSTSATLSSTSSYVTASRGSDPPPSSSSRHRHFKSVTATLPNFGRDERQSWASAHLRDHASNKTPPRGEAKASSPISPPHGHHKSEVKSTPTQTNLEKVPVSTTVDHTRAWVESVSDLATKGTSKTASTRTKADMPKENLRSSSSRTTSDDKKRSNGRSAETTTSSPATPNPPPFVPTAPPPPPYHVAALHPGMPGMTSMAVPMMGMPPMGIHPMGYPPMPPMTQPFFPPPWPYGPPGHNMDSIPSSVRDEPPPARTTTTRSGSTRHDSSSRPASSSERTPTTERTASSRDPRPSGHSSSKHSSSSRDKPAAEHASSSRRGSPSRHSRPSSRHESSSTRPTSPPRHTSPTDQASSTSRSSDKSEMSKAVDTSSSAAAADRTSSSTSSCTRQSSSRSRSRPKTYICAGCGKIRSSSYHHRLWMGVDRKAMSCYCGKCVDKATSSEGETEKKARRKKRKAREAREESQRDHEHRSCNSRQDVRDSSPSSTSSDDTIVDVRRVDSTRRKSHSSHRRCGSHGAQAGPSSDSRGGRGSRDNHSQSTSGGISGSSTHNHDATNWGGSPSEIPVSTSGSHWDPNLNDHHPTDSSHRQGPRQASDYHPRVGTEFERAAAEHRMATHPLPFRHVYTEDADETSSEDQAVRVDLPPMQRRGLLLQGNPSSSDGHQIVRHHSRRGESGHRDVMNRAVDLDEVDRSARRGHDRGGMYDGDSHSRGEFLYVSSFLNISRRRAD